MIISLKAYRLVKSVFFERISFENFLRNHKNKDMGITFLTLAIQAYIIYSVYFLYMCVLFSDQKF